MVSFYKSEFGVAANVGLIVNEVIIKKLVENYTPITRKLPPMLTPARAYRAEGRLPVYRQADVPGVRTSVEERRLLEPEYPPVTTYTCTTQYNSREH